jgi:hypothetical protein
VVELLADLAGGRHPLFGEKLVRGHRLEGTRTGKLDS